MVGVSGGDYIVGGHRQIDLLFAGRDLAKRVLMSSPQPPVISVMLAVRDAARAVEWYERALGATQLWNLGSVVGLDVQGAPFFVGEPTNNGWESPETLGLPSVRIEVFCDDPDAFIARALAEGATAGRHRIQVHDTPWGPHRQGGFVDPFGHVWFVGDRSPLARHPG